MRKKETMYRIILGLLILGSVCSITACNSLGLLHPTLSQTPECSGGTWSYAENIQTRINIDTDLQITLVQSSPNVVVTDTGGENKDASLTSKITVNGDGRVILEDIFYYYDQDLGEDKQEKEKRIQKEQLQQIVTVLEKANFYAITVGCNGTVQTVTDVPMMDIMVSSGGKVHEIKELGACFIYSFDRYCDLWSQVNEIIGEFPKSP
jgi:hypothetical protein